MAIEEPHFFPNGTDELYGVFHAPQGETRSGVLFCHALAEEKLWSHRVYVSFAREAAARGHAVLRFDMRGEGDSALEFEEATVATRVTDVITAFHELRARLPQQAPLVLVGHRFGGTVALAAAEQLGRLVSAVVIWDPILDGKDYVQQLLRTNLTTQLATEGKVTRNRDALIEAMLAGETVVVDGYGLTGSFYREVSELRLPSAPALESTSTLLLEVAKGSQTEPSAELRALCAERKNVACKLVAEQPFWRETRQFHSRAPALTAATLDYLASLNVAMELASQT